jgi:SM-20-related protein
MTAQTPEQWESWFDSLAFNDYVVIDNFLSDPLLENILIYFDELDHQGQFKKAAIGNANDQKVINEVRGDFIHWLSRYENQTTQELFDVFDALKMLINRNCYLSLKDFEFHFAHYPKGSFYKKHLDQFADRNNRLISVVIYLNTDWQIGDGGELKIYPKIQSEKLIQPINNRMVLFKSDQLYHEVMPAHKSRRSITGWMLHKPAQLAVITE